MPGRDGTGVMGRGAKTGRGLGNCKGANPRNDAGLGLGLGFKRGKPNFPEDPTMPTQKELLQKQKELLERKLDSISKQLES